jgi:hypothetical protein
VQGFSDEVRIARGRAVLRLIEECLQGSLASTPAFSVDREVAIGEELRVDSALLYELEEFLPQRLQACGRRFGRG